MIIIWRGNRPEEWALVGSVWQGRICSVLGLGGFPDSVIRIILIKSFFLFHFLFYFFRFSQTEFFKKKNDGRRTGFSRARSGHISRFALTRADTSVPKLN
ncbi:hypothetical protein BO71DRAFT_37855 [Aspergillus ellipticus CBS 707.79]|uniref:Uncharacterized protein n=1 Tax=Aspergillus ellipticus CBS 707.79 TaxID=1448320 RepID=A0A319DCC7_9EURO|nr:hypothetical protein BO71DRAFT_37855 [Aspergillus ellipticus CBS 707.79]